MMRASPREVGEGSARLVHGRREGEKAGSAQPLYRKRNAQGEGVRS